MMMIMIMMFIMTMAGDSAGLINHEVLLMLKNITDDHKCFLCFFSHLMMMMMMMTKSYLRVVVAESQLHLGLQETASQV